MTAYYLIKGTDEEAAYPGLKGKKVAVVCRPLVSLQYRNANVAQDISQQISDLLGANVPKVKMVSQRKIARWIDEHNFEDFNDVGKAMDADMVVGIDLESFTIYQGQTLYQGRANTTVRVYDCKADGKKTFAVTMPQSVFPPNTSVPTYDMQEADFRHQFVQVLAAQIARNFHKHDGHADIGLDALALKSY